MAHAPYVIGLTILALLGFGLVRRWGEVAPHWVPGLGGRRIPPVAPATFGGLLLTALGIHWLHEATTGPAAWPYDPRCAYPRPDERPRGRPEQGATGVDQRWTSC